VTIAQATLLSDEESQRMGRAFGKKERADRSPGEEADRDLERQL
jgi:hypothetical protein